MADQRRDLRSTVAVSATVRNNSPKTIIIPGTTLADKNKIYTWVYYRYTCGMFYYLAKPWELVVQCIENRRQAEHLTNRVPTYSFPVDEVTIITNNDKYVFGRLAVKPFEYELWKQKMLKQRIKLELNPRTSLTTRITKLTADYNILLLNIIYTCIK